MAAPNTYRSVPTWTRQDQFRLDELLRQKQEFDELHKGALQSFLNDKLPFMSDAVPTLIKHADELRDLLLPFDSGVRPSSNEV